MDKFVGKYFEIPASEGISFYVYSNKGNNSFKTVRVIKCLYQRHIIEKVGLSAESLSELNEITQNDFKKKLICLELSGVGLIDGTDGEWKSLVNCEI